MKWRITVLALWLALPLFSEPVQVMYYNSFGDYVLENVHQIDIDIQNTSLQQIRSTLQRFRGGTAMDADLVLIGYGAQSAPTNFFAATAYVDYQIPLGVAISQMPERIPDGQWYIFYIDESLSHHVRARKDHHWASPFRWLAQIGLQNLHYFGPL
jgi:hypothetical protein